MNLKKALVYGALGLATVAGTYSSHERDFPPFFVRKTGTSGGICVGASVKLEEGAKFYGLILSASSGNRGTINGINLSLANTGLGGKVNGAELGILANAPEVGSNKPTSYIGPINTPNNINGLQASIFINMCNRVSGGQIGLINRINRSNPSDIDPVKDGFLLNYDF